MSGWLARALCWACWASQLCRGTGQSTWQGPEPLGRLLKVFGLSQPGRRERHAAPPQYMLDLYRSTADSKGVARAVNPYYATVVRSFPGEDFTAGALHFAFNASFPAGERLLEAEFHLYKLKPKLPLARRITRAHLLEVRVYQMLSEGRNGQQKIPEAGHRLLDIRRVSAHSVGWEVFYVKPAVIDWSRDNTKNFGLLVTVSTLSGSPAEDGMLRFARRHPHHVNRQPLLVVFADDGKKQHTGRPPEPPPSVEFRDYGYPELSFYRTEDHESDPPVVPTPPLDLSNNINNSSEARARRASDPTQTTYNLRSPSPPGSCGRHELYVDFEKIGWSSWIISPKGYHAFYCRGQCAFPLGQDQWPTNHATVQSIVHELHLSTEDLGTPCCVPNKLLGVSLLYFDDQGNVILKQYDDMVAASCGCH